MESPLFSIDVTDLHWINGTADDPDDLCLHGHASVTIGEKHAEYDATVSAAALYLLKTLTQDHICDAENQLLPCCGFTMLPYENGETCVICGCPNGVDWTVTHDGGDVLLTVPECEPVRVPLPVYQDAVFQFADKVEAYYRACAPKTEPKDAEERDGWHAFWREWNRRRHMQYDGT